MLRKLLLFAALLIPASAQAEWKEASSQQFLVYSQGSEANLRDFTEKLEKFDYLLRKVSGTHGEISPTKLKIYLVRDMKAVQETMYTEPQGVAGYYTTTPRGPVAIGFQGSNRVKGENVAQIVLLHEYTHHFMFHHFPASYPSWYSEGFADYYGQTQILDNDVIEVGHPAENRYLSFRGNRWLPLNKLLAARSYADIPELDLLYAEGWLLVHYLAQNKERAGQLEKYLNLINAGKSYEEATNEAFGSGATKLDGELRSYASKARHDVTVLPFKKIDIQPVQIRSLTPAEDALMPEEITLARGLLQIEAQDFVADVRKVAQKFPNDAHALNILVEAEQAAGNLANARQAVDKLLEVEPKHTRGLMHKGELELAALKQAGNSNAAAWDKARAYIIQANRTNPNDPMVLQAYYNSFVTQGVLPPAPAQNALYRAHELVPRDDELSYRVARDFEQRGMIEEAMAVIKPSAFQLHSEETDAKKKKRQDEMRAKYRGVEEENHETAREMYLRLEQKLAAGKKAA